MTPRLAESARLGTVAAQGAAAQIGVLFAIFFASGFAALVYQVLWVRGLGLLFGSTAEAAAIAIAIFFAGLASGGWYWGRRAPRYRSAIFGFAVLELAVAGTALGHFILLDVYHAAHPALHALAGQGRLSDTLIKGIVAAVILLPPAFLMGGTLPLMGQHVIRRHEELGRTGSALYAVNTAGGAFGALAAGFILPLALGFAGAYLVAVGVDVAVGIIALALARRPEPPSGSVARIRSSSAQPSLKGGEDSESMAGTSVWVVAFGSGVATLAIEVLWTRLFAQVLQNSAYTYSLVLTSFLVALALGAVVANFLTRLPLARVPATLCAVLGASAAVTLASPILFIRLTDGLTYVGARHGWGGYIAAVVALCIPVMLVPGAVIGTVLPYLLRALERRAGAPGELIGRLVAANTAGAIAGSLAAGFVLLPRLGANASLGLLAGTYAVLLLTVAALELRRFRAAVIAGTALATLIGAVAFPRDLQRIHLEAGERLVELREGTAAHVAIVERSDGLAMRVNNYYTLGATVTAAFERNQAVLPLLTHPAPRDVFFIGLGTGMTAGGALFFPVENVVVCEILPDVIDLARIHFRPWSNGLFEDPRVVILAEDGRTCLSRSPDTYDVIIGDLFTPWHAGTGSLFSVEHFRTVRRRLNPGGIFAQWIPLHQVSELELGIIANTMRQVFPEVVMWRADLYADQAALALFGFVEPQALDPEVVRENARLAAGDATLPQEDVDAITLPFYAGNIGRSHVFDGYPVNTDNRPLIELLAPRTYRAVVAGQANWVTGPNRDRLFEAVLSAVPPDSDPYLARLTSDQRALIRAVPAKPTPR